MKRYLLIPIVLGLTGCVEPVSEPAICAGLNAPVTELRAALIANPQTPEPVGEAGTDVVLGYNAGCKP